MISKKPISQKPNPPTQKLQKRPLGNTGIEVSCLGLGTVKLGRNEGVKYPRPFTLPSDLEVKDLLAKAGELGINFLDTAPAYGSSEERLGRLLTNRDNWILASKVGEEFSDGKSYFDFSATHARASVERSLSRLDTDYLDIVLIHSNGDDLEILQSSGCLEALMKLREQGLIRAVGMSTKTVAGGLKAVELTDLVMVSFNTAHTGEETVIDYAAEQGTGVLIKKALASGHIAGAQTSSPQTPSDSTADSLRFAVNKTGVSSVIVGTINPRHLAENVASVMADGD